MKTEVQVLTRIPAVVAVALSVTSCWTANHYSAAEGGKMSDYERREACTRMNNIAKDGPPVRTGLSSGVYGLSSMNYDNASDSMRNLRCRDFGF